MKIAIVGYGRMGKVVEKHSLQRGDEIVAIIDPSQNTKKEDLLGKDFDVIIEFSIPQVAMDNLNFYAKNGFKVVMATTGWWENLTEIKETFNNSKGAIIWSGNFSLGVNLFYSMLEKVSKIMNKIPEYDVFGHEYHHKMKADSPSGTLINMGDIILENIDRKTEKQVNCLNERPIKDEELHLSSIRGGNIPGTHIITFDSEFDTIELKHTARTRDGFAVGSLVCGEWLKERTGYFEIKDFTNSL
ncbi:MAG: 4-hydroxy-tetrahydrodipicolinate reductase [Candidatus Gracilibacteria bacterium]|nr:4-hydroxy-tetrahydrodipicolinate reductase [Candidatus Gracilibacteria bacterium]MDQ7023346.1 4-hydroxy-tetrahydrodipicolinate reductase [Candidatus Gracilibacteria bacterium]